MRIYSVSVFLNYNQKLILKRSKGGPYVLNMQEHIRIYSCWPTLRQTGRKISKPRLLTSYFLFYVVLHNCVRAINGQPNIPLPD